MRPFRKNLAISIDGGGLRGLVPICALEMVEKELGKPIHELARLICGTSTGSVIAAALASGLSAAEMHKLYLKLGNEVFQPSWRTLPLIGFFARYKFPREPLAKALHEVLGDRKVGDFWEASPSVDLVIPTFDLVWSKTRFIKSWKQEYLLWPLVDAVLASSAAPTFFSVFQGRFTDGSVGSFNNPCFLAAYEAKICLAWKAQDTTLISLGTGREPDGVHLGAAAKWHSWDWIAPVIGAFMNSAGDQQVDLVDKFFPQLDFRRFQVDMSKPMDFLDPRNMPAFEQLGMQMGKMILDDHTDLIAQDIQTPTVKSAGGPAAKPA